MFWGIATLAGGGSGGSGEAGEAALPGLCRRARVVMRQMKPQARGRGGHRGRFLGSTPRGLSFKGDNM